MDAAAKTLGSLTNAHPTRLPQCPVAFEMEKMDTSQPRSTGE
jgi:hypothetical protein